MEPVNDNWLQTNHPKYFLPHHCVIKEDSSTTRLRVVFDGSTTSSNGKSLNDNLLVGATLQRDLFSILLQFRMLQYVIAADITKMYRQILVNTEDQRYQLILWRDSQEKVVVMKLNTVTYGTASAPFLALVLTLEEALQIKNEVVALLNRGSFPLRKWMSNCADLISDVASEDLEKYIEINDQPTIKTLGMIWQPNLDVFYFKYEKNDDILFTKRSILAEVGRFFDPLGILAPVVIASKLFLQHLWVINLGWDDTLPSDLNKKWQRFREEMALVHQITVPRLVTSSSKLKGQLHGFCDASNKAYGCCIYLVTITLNGSRTSTLLTAKTRVATVKTISTARLELNGALLLAELTNKVLATGCFSFEEIYCWCDSSIVLSWISNPPINSTVFIANRVTKIQEISKDMYMWRHVPTALNPADWASRGKTARYLINQTFWFTGPDFLLQDECNWPDDIERIKPQQLPEQRQLKFSFTTTKFSRTDLTSDCLKFQSSYLRLLRVFVYVLRFFYLRKETEQRSLISVSELEKAQRTIVKNLQMVYFKEEYNELERGNPVSKKSKILNLSPFLDSHGIIRVGGRLQNANISYDHKHQMLLPRNHPFTKAILHHFHIIHGHCGTQFLLNAFRQRFWITSGKRVASNLIHHCVTCFRMKPVTQMQMMGNLPIERVQFQRPFKRCGVDFCGPVMVRSGIRGRKSCKQYICIFICFITKAVHLEVVPDLTTKTFLMILQKMISRRGKPDKIFSDNATNFIGAKNKLRDLHLAYMKKSHIEELQANCLKESIDWITIPPRSPHFGGLWEASVKIAKFHLNRILLSYMPTSFELSTFICQVEAIMNSRPITPTSSDPNDLTALTPGHFLISRPLTSFNIPDYTNENPGRLDNYQRMCQLQQVFWKRWHNEVLNNMQIKPKWSCSVKNIQVGDMVILVEENQPFMKWPLARVQKVFPGQDGKVRVVEIKTENGIYCRSVTKICKLPIEEGNFQGGEYVGDDINRSEKSNEVGK